LINKIESLIKIAASTVAIVASLILLSGYSYHLGYVITFELSTDLISKSMSEVLVESWYVGVRIIIWIFDQLPYFISYFLILCFAMVFGFLAARWCQANGKTWVFDEISIDNQGRKIFWVSQWHWKCLIEGFSEITMWFSYPALILAMIGLLTILPFEDAKGYANKQMELFKEHGCSEKTEKYSCIYLIDIDKQQNKVLAKGILVSANNKRIAIYNNKLEVWPLLDNYIIRKNTDVGWVEQSETQRSGF
jgi:hypothetical protein